MSNLSFYVTLEHDELRDYSKVKMYLGFWQKCKQNMNRTERKTQASNWRKLPHLQQTSKTIKFNFKIVIFQEDAFWTRFPHLMRKFLTKTTM